MLHTRYGNRVLLRRSDSLRKQKRRLPRPELRIDKSTWTAGTRSPTPRLRPGSAGRLVSSHPPCSPGKLGLYSQARNILRPLTRAGMRSAPRTQPTQSEHARRVQRGPQRERTPIPAVAQPEAVRSRTRASVGMKTDGGGERSVRVPARRGCEGALDMIPQRLRKSSPFQNGLSPTRRCTPRPRRRASSSAAAAFPPSTMPTSVFDTQLVTSVITARDSPISLLRDATCSA